MANYNLSLPAETIDSLLLWLDDKQGVIIKQTDLLSGTGQSITGTMTQKAITDALGTKADSSNVYTKAETNTLLGGKADKSTTYTKTETDELIAPLATKEDVEAVEQEVAQVAGEAGLAEAVIDTDGVGTEQEFTFRKSGGDGGAYYRKIKGKTLAWNQLCSDGEEQRQLTNSSAGSYSVNVINGHKCLARFIANLSTRTSGYLSNNLFKLAYGGTTEQFGDASIGINSINHIFTAGADASAATLSLNYVSSGSENTGNISKFGFTDLTLIYGSALDGKTDTEILAMYEADFGTGYHEYTPGTLISNDAEAVETTGVNQWDEEWVNGYWDNSGLHADARFICSKNKIKVIPGETYFFRGPSIAFEVIGYDAEGGYVQYIGAAISNSQFIIPAGISYITFNPTNVEALTTYNHDICINLSNPAINGQYFPYWKRTLQLGITTRKDTDGNVPFADGMKGAGTAADWADKVGGEKRMGRVDLGSLTGWTKYTEHCVYCTLVPYALDGGAISTYICNKYISVAGNQYAALAEGTLGNGIAIDSLTRVWIYDENIDADADIVSWQIAKLNGVMLDYPFATPVPFTWAEPLNLGVKVDENGTERAVAPEGATAPSAPFVADTTYTMSVARMVEKLKNL